MKKPLLVMLSLAGGLLLTACGGEDSAASRLASQPTQTAPAAPAAPTAPSPTSLADAPVQPARNPVRPQFAPPAETTAEAQGITADEWKPDPSYQPDDSALGTNG